MQNFLKSLPDAETIRYWRLVLSIRPRGGNIRGPRDLQEILTTLLVMEEVCGTNGGVEFNINGLNPVRYEPELYALRYQADHPDAPQCKRLAWGDQLKMYNVLCDNFGHQGRLWAGFINGPLRDRGFDLDGEGNIVRQWEQQDGGC